MTETSSLVLFNQSVDLARVARVILATKGHVTLISSHRLYREEVLFLKKQAGDGNNVSIKSISDYLSEEEMNKIDDSANLFAKRICKKMKKNDQYNRIFMNMVVRKKNKLIYLKEKGKHDKNFFVDGLGIDGDFWGKRGGINLGYPKKKLIAKISSLPPKIKNVISRRFVLQRIVKFSSGISHIYFFSSMKRVPTRTNGEKRLVFGLGKDQNLILGKKIASFSDKIPSVIGTTVHGWHPNLAKCGCPVEIFVDGHHPTNYPRSYGDGFFCATIISRNMFDYQWFSSLGLPVKKPYGFLEPTYFDEPLKTETVSTVILLMNHSGDWSALINRSDTDDLLLLFEEAARQYPDVDFVVRPHPTMVHPEHEGGSSLKRLQEHVKQSGLPNLRVSKAALAEDFRRGDLFVSEYSQTLIDAMRIGKLGLICNPTHRRSFMADFERLGFARVERAETLAGAIGAILSSPENLVRQQGRAVGLFNTLLAEFRGETA